MNVSSTAIHVNRVNFLINIPISIAFVTLVLTDHDLSSHMMNGHDQLVPVHVHYPKIVVHCDKDWCILT